MFVLAALIACTSGKSVDTAGLEDSGAVDTGAGTSAGNDTSTDTGTSENVVTPESFPEAAAVAACVLMERCDRIEGDLNFSNYEECVTFLTGELTTFVAACASFDAAAAAACIEAQSTATCADATGGDGSHFAACYEVCG